MKLIDKKNMSVTVGVAFVWFTTQFGGGFASGAQLFQYFMKFGIWTLFTPIIAQAIGAFFQWYALRHAYNNKLYDYRSFNEGFYGKFSPIFSNLYEVVYIMLLALAPSVAFATGGATLAALTGLPYILCTFIIGIFIFLVAIYGTEVVRKVASTLSVLIIVGLLVVYIPNIIAQWSTITSTISTLAAEKASAGPALWSCFIYASFQLASIGLLVQHAESFHSEKDAKTSMVYGFIVNAGIIFISTLGLLAVAKDPRIGTEAIPILILIKNGVGSSFMTPIISALIVLGSVSTAVNMIAGIVNRVVCKFEKPEPASNETSGKQKPSKLTIIIALAFTILAFAIAQFGLIPLVAKGYGYLGYATIAVVIIPFIVHMFLKKMEKVN